MSKIETMSITEVRRLKVALSTISLNRRLTQKEIEQKALVEMRLKKESK